MLGLPPCPLVTPDAANHRAKSTQAQKEVYSKGYSLESQELGEGDTLILQYLG